MTEGAPSQDVAGAELYVVSTATTPHPEVHLLSNGRYSVMVTNAGGGYSRWKGLALTRWREDPTRDDWGTFCYVRDVSGGEAWSVAHQPTGRTAEVYEAIFPQSRAEFRRRDHGIDTHTEIAVSPEDDIELRKFTLFNRSNRRRTLELTTYAEVVLAPPADDNAHPAFSNLFVQTEIIAQKQAILCSRRPRDDDEQSPVLLHLLVVHGQMDGTMSFETDRRTFIGRGRSVASPKGELKGTDGSVLDPIVAIRCRVTLAPEQSLSLHMVTGVAPTREAALLLVDKYRDRHLGDRVFELAWTHRQVVLQQLGVCDAAAQIYLRMASSLLYANPLRRAPPGLLARNRRGQSSLWAYGISGDLPIVLLRVATTDSIDLVRQVVQAHGYWRSMGLAVDLVICHETDSAYLRALQEQILAVIAATGPSSALDVPGGIFVRRLEQFADEDRVLVQVLARILLREGGGDLPQQDLRWARPTLTMPRLVPTLPATLQAAALAPPPLSRSLPARDELLFANTLGGFVKDGRAYQIETTAARLTPAPWANVIANPHFGTVISESGGAYTWCENAHEFRLTPWENDALTDRSGEAFYLRDEETGLFWSPTPLPARGPSPYITRHGFGYSTFSHTGNGIESELTTFVAIDAPVKITVIRLVNRSTRSRSLSVTGAVEWVLGEQRAQSLLHVTTEIDPVSDALLARNFYHREFGARIGFFDLSERRRSVTGDRTELLGRNGRYSHPAAMGRERLSGRVGAGLDAAAAMQAVIVLAPGEEREVSFLLGVGRDVGDVRTLIRRFGHPAHAKVALAEVKRHWEQVLSTVQVETPDPAMDVLVNGWIPYQIISCRLWARTGYYQSGGAFGFRDQLQDAMALLHTRPELLREQIVRCSARQYQDGDVQHWWHPPAGQGVRTHCSDDYLWLPAAVSRYVLGIGDTGLLDVTAHFLEGRQVKPDEEAYGDQPRRSEQSATVYEHCVRAIQYGLKFGPHGLPLIGSGDWSDGMNLVGLRGRGESVWLAFFLYDVLCGFAPVALGRGDTEFHDTCLREAAQLAANIEIHAWDGDWYRRAWFDGGEALGSRENVECQIDSLPQSWAVLSQAGPRARARQAMESVDTRLVDRDHGIIKLFDPPFDRALPSPGYIQGYVPGVRENGGQYTHAAIWAAMAFARLGDWSRAHELTWMINPLSHVGSAEARDRYRVEPYVLAADVYAVAPHAGLGGWSWYTGSAGWMLRLVVESLLGLNRSVDRLTFTPCVPPSWPGFTIRYRHRRSLYTIAARPVAEGEVQGQVVVDGRLPPESHVTLVDDGLPHSVELRY